MTSSTKAGVLSVFSGLELELFLPNNLWRVRRSDVRFLSFYTQRNISKRGRFSQLFTFPVVNVPPNSPLIRPCNAQMTKNPRAPSQASISIAKCTINFMTEELKRSIWLVWKLPLFKSNPAARRRSAKPHAKEQRLLERRCLNGWGRLRCLDLMHTAVFIVHYCIRHLKTHSSLLSSHRHFVFSIYPDVTGHTPSNYRSTFSLVSAWNLFAKMVCSEMVKLSHGWFLFFSGSWTLSLT